MLNPCTSWEQRKQDGSAGPPPMMAAAIADCMDWETETEWQISCLADLAPRTKDWEGRAYRPGPVADVGRWHCVRQLQMHMSVSLLFLLPGWTQVVPVLQFQVAAVLQGEEIVPLSTERMQHQVGWSLGPMLCVRSVWTLPPPAAC